MNRSAPRGYPSRNIEKTSFGGLCTLHPFDGAD
jgi:hypothetical protein